MRKIWLSAVPIVLVISACGGGDGSDGQAETDPVPDIGGETTVTVASPDDSAGTTSPDSPDDGGPPGGFPPGGDGTVVIDGQTFDAAWVGNCEIDEVFNPGPDDLDLTAALGTGIDALFLRVSYRDVQGVPPEDGYLYTQFGSELQMQDDSGNFVLLGSVGNYVTGPDGTWYVDDIGTLPMILATDSDPDATPLAVAPMTIDGDRISGTVTLKGSSREPRERSR